MDIKNLVQKYWKIAAAALAVLLLVILVIPKNNTSKTPIKAMEKMSNAKNAEKMLDRSVEMLNGLGEKELEQIFEIMMKTESFQNIVDSMGESLDDMRNEIGMNYKVKLSVESKEKLDKSYTQSAQEGVDLMAEHFAARAEALEEDSTYLEDEGLSGKDIKKLIKCYKKLAKIFQKAKVTKVVDLEVESKVKGSQLDEPMVSTQYIRVMKIKGRWVSEDALSMLMDMA